MAGKKVKGSKTDKKADGLTPKKRRFAEAYALNMNGSKAAIAAGYSEASSRAIAYQLLQEPAVREYVEKLKAKAAADHGITRDRVAKELARLAFSDTRKLYDQDGNLKPIHELDDDTAASIAGLEVDTEYHQVYGEARDENGDLVKEFTPARTVTKKVKLSDKKGALDSIAKMFGYNEPEKTENVNTTTILVTPEEAKAIKKAMDSEI